MIFVEVIETPQRDWWVVADGRVVGTYLKTGECPDPLELAIEHGEDLAKPFGMSILSIGTTWRSMAFDHLEEMGCRRGACCRMREMTEAEQDAFVEAEQASLAGRVLNMHFDSMERMANVQIRDVPEDVHRQLKSQAALAGQSLNEFLLARVTELARLPTVPELLDRIHERGEPYEGPSSAALIRAERDLR